MTGILKISEDFYEDTFTLIALHSSLENFKLAYKLNQSLKASFKRCREDLDISQDISFSIFDCKDLETDGYWSLINNQSFVEDKQIKESLFQDHSSFTIHYLLPEFKEVDFFLKIEQEGAVKVKEVVDKINKIPEIVTAYSVENETIKSINNLIY